MNSFPPPSQFSTLNRHTFSLQPAPTLALIAGCCIRSRGRKASDMAAAKIRLSVLEYLRFHRLTSTAECFEAETSSKMLDDKVDGSASVELQAQLLADFLTCFDKKRPARLFAMWDKHVPNHLRKSDATAMREFRSLLSVHCRTSTLKLTFRDRHGIPAACPFCSASFSYGPIPARSFFTTL